MLTRAHRFLTVRERADLEAAAERFFGALGYRRRADEAAGALVFERGRRFASLWSPSLRACRARVEVELRPGRASPDPEAAGDPVADRGTGVATVRHQVETSGRLVLAADLDLVDAEAKAFQQFLENADVDASVLIDAVRRSGRAAALAMIGAVIGVAAAAAVVVGLILARG